MLYFFIGAGFLAWGFVHIFSWLEFPKGVALIVIGAWIMSKGGGNGDGGDGGGCDSDGGDD